jgi:hypothetical protein
MPWLLSRALLVLGGAVAATATAWLITSAPASADALPALPGLPGISSPSPDLTAVTGAVSDALTSVGVPSVLAHPAAMPLPDQAAAKVRGVTGELRAAVGKLGYRVHVDRAIDRAIDKDLTAAAPPLTVLPSTPQVVPTPAGQSGPAAGRSPARTLPIAAATIVAPVPVGPSVAQRSGDRPSPRPSTHTTPHTAVLTPSSPVAPAQWAPATLPSAPAGGGAGAPGPGGLGLLDTAGAFPVPGLDLVCAVPVTTPLGTGTAGRQPGSTPD